MKSMSLGPFKKVFRYIINKHIDEGHETDNKRLYNFLEEEHKQRYYFAANFCEEKKVLDLACSDGYGSIILSQKAQKVDAVDKRGIYLRRPKSEQPKNINFIKADIFNYLNIYSDKYDVIVALEIIEHVENYELLLTLCKKCLKKGGTLILSTPNYLITETLNGSIANPFHHKEFYSEEMLEILVDIFDIQPQMYVQWPINSKHIVMSSLWEFIIKRKPTILENDGSVIGLNNIFVVSGVKMNNYLSQ